jgi:uncharacterized protein
MDKRLEWDRQMGDHSAASFRRRTTRGLPGRVALNLVRFGFPKSYDRGGLILPLTMPLFSDDMKRLVQKQRLGYVATVSPQGRPNVSPKGSVTLWGDDHLVFADIESPRTIRNLEMNPNIEVNVVDPEVRKGYRFTGTAKVLREGDRYWKVLEHYKAEGADIRRVRAIVLIAVNAAAPLVSPCYVTGLTEDEVRALWAEWHRKSSDKMVVDLVPPSDF